MLRDAIYWAEILLSAGIATLGLTLGSPAVIIGAMLISPLMAPIMAAGLSLAAGDFVLAIRATISIVTEQRRRDRLFHSARGVASLSRDDRRDRRSDAFQHARSRHRAFLGGDRRARDLEKHTRGRHVDSRRRDRCRAHAAALRDGYGLGVLVMLDRAQGLSIVRGGALLYVTNLVAITFASMIVFLMLHLDDETVRTRIREWRHGDPGSARFQNVIDRVVPAELRRIGGLPARLLLVVILLGSVFMPLKRSARSFIERLDVVDRGGRLGVDLRAIVTESISADEREAYRERLARELGRPPQSMDVRLIEIPTSQFQVAKRKTETEIAPAPAPESVGQRLSGVAEEIVSELNATRLPPGADLIDAALSIASAGPEATITYLAPASISEDARALIESQLQKQLDLTRLTVRLDWIPSHTTATFVRGRTPDPATIVSRVWPNRSAAGRTFASAWSAMPVSAEQARAVPLCVICRRRTIWTPHSSQSNRQKMRNRGK